MKIMHISPLKSYPSFSDLIGKQKKKHDVIFVKLDFTGENRDYELDEKVKSDCITIKNVKKISNQTYDNNLRKIFDVLLKKRKPDIVHVHVFSGVSLLPILNVASSLGIRKVITLHDNSLLSTREVCSDICNQCDKLLCTNGSQKEQLTSILGDSSAVQEDSKDLDKVYNDVVSRKLQDLSLKLGYECNQNCIYCSYADARKTTPSETIDFVGISEVLRKNRKAYDILELTTSSEPTILKDFFRIVELAYRLGYQIELVTNGRMFSYDEFCRKLEMYNIRLIVFCLHSSNPEIHDTTTRVKGSFNQAVKGIKSMVKYNFNTLAQIILTNINYPHLLETVKFIAGLGVTNIRITFPDPYGATAANSYAVLPRYSDVRPFVNQTLSWLKNRKDIHVDLKSFPYCCIDTEFQSKAAEGITTAVISLIEEDTPFYITKLERVNNMKQKFDICKICKYNNKCEGIWKNYIAKYGKEEFKPVK